VKSKVWVVAALVVYVTSAWAESKGTPKDMVATYATLADGILALRRTEENFVRALLDGHRHAAVAMHARGDHEGVAAEMAFFANEGDNAVAGVRKRLLEGGHHHNAAGEAQGIYEPGFVVVTREVKKQVLDAAAAYQKATTDGDRTKAFEAFAKAADSLVKK
jgi:hypothetical protein